MIYPGKIMGRLFLLVIFFASAGMRADAQSVLEVDSEPRLLASDGSAMFMQPRWSPVSDDLIVTGTGYRGLWRVMTDGSVMALNDERGAGFQMSWSPDGKYVATRVAQYENRRRQNAIVVIDVENAERSLLTEFANGMPAKPAWLSDSLITVVEEAEPRVVYVDGRMSEDAQPGKLLVADGDRLVRNEAGIVEDVLQSVTGRDILNLETSKDGSMVAFEEMGGNLFLARADGSGRIDLGRGHRPRWSPDGAWLIYMVTEDNGHTFTSSDLYAARVSDGHVVRLTATPDILEMNPDWSHDGRQIAYDDDRGSIYTVSITTR